MNETSKTRLSAEEGGVGGWREVAALLSVSAEEG